MNEILNNLASGAWSVLTFFLNMTQDLGMFLWHAILLLAPVLLLGLFLSGLIHVFVSRQAFLKWLQKDDLKTIALSGAIGVPLPLCSCSVLPVVAEMRHKGASRSACMSFLITAPETGADSILITHVFFGWLAALVRPFISFVTAVITGLFCVLWSKHDTTLTKRKELITDPCCDKPVTKDECCEDSSTPHKYLNPHIQDCYVSVKQLGMVTRSSFSAIGNAINSIQFLRRTTQPKVEARSETPVNREQQLTLRKILSHVLSYGFKSVADDILFALLVGLLLGGVLYLFFPTDLLSKSWAQWLSYPVMMIVSVPLYICASASTPIAAGLVAGGLSPGAALIFLMSGPATNMATISVIGSQFGSRFASIYVSGVMGVTLVAGILVDLVLWFTGFSIAVNLGDEHAHVVQLLQYASVALFIGLVIWRFRAGALRSGWREMVGNFYSVRDYFASKRRVSNVN